MVLDLIVQEAEGMSDDELMEVLRYMRFIKTETTRMNPHPPPTPRLSRIPHSCPGVCEP